MIELITEYKARFIASFVAAAVAVCALPFIFEPAKVEADVISSNALVSEIDARGSGYTSNQEFRDAVLAACAQMDGVNYVWGGAGWDGLDCAGSVSLAYAVALGSATINSTSGSYGSKTISFSGGGNPDYYGFYRPGYAGIRTSFTNGILYAKGVTPTENHFAGFDFNGTYGIQSDEWIYIVDTYGFQPGDMILWWNDDNDSSNAQHITIYAGIENGVPMHWTGSSSMGYFCKKPLADSSAEAGKGSFTGFMGLKAVEPFDTPYVGFYLDKTDTSGNSYTGAIFSVYSDSSLSTKIGELRDDDGNGIYADYYGLSGGDYYWQMMQIPVSDPQSQIYETTIYVKETSCPTGMTIPNGNWMSLTDSSGTVPDYYQFIDPNAYTVTVRLSQLNGSTGVLEYWVVRGDGTVMYSDTDYSYSYRSGSEAVVIANSYAQFSDASAISLSKSTTTGLDITSTVITVQEGSTTVATFKYTYGGWNWYDAYDRLWDSYSFPLKYGTTYTLTETFSKPDPFKCVDGNTVDYPVSNDTAGWTKIDDTTYSYTFTTASIEYPNTYSFSAENNMSAGSIKAVKFISDDDDTRDGFEFELWNDSKTILLAKGKSGTDGIVMWETGSGSRLSEFTLPSGDYVIAENVPSRYYGTTSDEYTYKIPEGFEDGKDGKWYKKITIGTDLLTVNVTNDRSESAVSVSKTSEDGFVDNVGFEIYYGGKGEAPDWQSSSINYGMTDRSGYLVFTRLPEGWYRIDEDTKPIYSPVWDDGTEGSSRIIHITEEDDNKVIEVSVYNRIDIAPVIRTELTSTDSSHDIWCGRQVEITDNVYYEDLVAGYVYEVTGTLVDKITGDVITDSEGNPYEVEVEFYADDSSGYVEVPFVIDSVYLFENAFAEGKDSVDIVCFETMTFRGKTIAVHEDLEDEDQTITILAPSISTSASDSETGTSVLALSDTVGINDEVSYEGLVPGDTYVVTGTLMDKSTGEIYEDEEGNTYVEELSFEAETSSGVVTVTFKDVKVTTDEVELVVFERLRAEASDKDIAVHEDIDDQDQTVGRPSCTTYAATSFGYKSFLSGSTVTIVDNVSYEGLVPGETYYARASLYLNDGTSVTNCGREVVSLQEFVPEEESGTVEVAIKFRATDLNEGDVVVVYENIYDKATEEETVMNAQSEDIIVLSHEDPNNKDQSLEVTTVPTLGDVANNDVVWLGIAFIVIGSAGIVIVFEVRRRRINKG